MPKKLNLKRHLILSFVASSMLYSQALALPSGGKFVQGGGSITSGGGNMNIHGNGKDQNHVINWGGGFNIGKDESVNFSGQGHHKFLNLDYSKNASQIYGQLNGNGHDIFLVNPNGTIIGNGAVINTGKFGISTGAMNEAQIKEFATSGKFSPVFSPAQKGTITIQGDAILNVSNLQLVGNKIVLKSEEQKSPNITSKEKFELFANSIELNSGNIKANTVNLNTNYNETLNGQIRINGANFDTTSMDLNSKLIHLGNSTVKNGDNFAKVNANAEQINLNGTFSAGDTNLKATNIIGDNKGNFDIKGTLSLDASQNISLLSTTLNATNLSLLNANYIELENATLKANALTLNASGDSSLIRVIGSNLESASSLDLNANEIRFGKHENQNSTIKLTGDETTANIKTNDKLALDDTQITVSTKATLNLEANSQLSFSNSSFSGGNNSEFMAKTAENGVLILENSKLDNLANLTLTANQIKISNDNTAQNTIKTKNATLNATDKIIANNANFDISSGLNFSATNYIYLNGSNFTLGSDGSYIFSANQTKIDNASFSATGGGNQNLEFKSNAENSQDSVIEVNNINFKDENIANVKFNAHYLNIKSGNIKAASKLDFIGDRIDLGSNETLSLKASELKADAKQLFINNANLSGTSITLDAEEVISIDGEKTTIGSDTTTTLQLLSKNLIELKNGTLKGTNITLKALNDDNTKGVIDLKSGSIAANDNGKIDLDAMDIKFEGANLSAKELDANALNLLAISGQGEIKAETLILKGTNKIAISGNLGDENSNITLDTNGLFAVSGGLLKAKTFGVNAGKIDFKNANLSASGNIDFKAQNSIIISQDANSQTSITSTGGSLNLGKKSSSKANDEAEVGFVIDLNGGTLSSVDTKINADEININGATINGGALELLAKRILASSGNINVNGDAYLLATNLIELGSEDAKLNFVAKNIKINDKTGEAYNAFNGATSAVISIKNATLEAKENNTKGDIIIKGADIKTTHSNSIFKAKNITLDAENKIEIIKGDLQADRTLSLDGKKLVQVGLKDDSGVTMPVLKGTSISLISENLIDLQGGNFTATNNINLTSKNGNKGTILLSGANLIANGENDAIAISTQDFLMSGGSLKAKSGNIKADADNIIEITKGALEAKKITLDGANLVSVSGGENGASITSSDIEFITNKLLELTALSLSGENFKFEADQININGGSIIATGKLELLATKGSEANKGGKLNLSDGVNLSANELNLKARNDIILNNANLSATTSANLLANNYIEMTGGKINSASIVLKGLDEGKTLKEIKISGAKLAKNDSENATNIDLSASQITIENSSDLKANTITLNAKDSDASKGGVKIDNSSLSANDLTLKGDNHIVLSGITFTITNALKLLADNYIQMNSGSINAKSLTIKDSNEGENLKFVELIKGDITLTGTTDSKGAFDIIADQINIGQASAKAQDKINFTLENITANLKAKNQILINNADFSLQTSTFDLSAVNKIALESTKFQNDTKDSTLKLNTTSQEDGKGIIVVKNSQISGSSLEVEAKIVDLQGLSINANSLALKALDKLLIQASSNFTIENTIALEATNNLFIKNSNITFNSALQNGDNDKFEIKAAQVLLNTANLTSKGGKFSITATDTSGLFKANNSLIDVQGGSFDLSGKQIVFTADKFSKLHETFKTSSGVVTNISASDFIGLTNVKFTLAGNATFKATNDITTNNVSLMADSQTLSFDTKIFNATNGLAVTSDTLEIKGADVNFDDSMHGITVNHFNIDASNKISINGGWYVINESLKWLATNHIEVKGGSRYDNVEFAFGNTGNYIFSAKYQQYQNTNFNGGVMSSPDSKNANVKFGVWSENGGSGTLTQAEYIKLDSSNIFGDMADLSIKAKTIEFGAQMGESYDPANIGNVDLEADSLALNGFDFSGIDNFTFKGTKMLSLSNITFTDITSGKFLSDNLIKLENITATNSNIVFDSARNFELTGYLDISGASTLDLKAANLFKANNANIIVNNGSTLKIDGGKQITFNTSSLAGEGTIELSTSKASTSDLISDGLIEFVNTFGTIGTLKVSNANQFTIIGDKFTTFDIENADWNLRNKIRLQDTKLSIGNKFIANAGKDFIINSSNIEMNTKQDSNLNATNIYMNDTVFSLQNSTAKFTLGSDTTELIKLENENTEGFHGSSDLTELKAKYILAKNMDFSGGMKFNASEAISMENVDLSNPTINGSYDFYAKNYISLKNSTITAVSVKFETMADGNTGYGVINFNNVGIDINQGDFTMLANEINFENTDKSYSVDTANINWEAKNNMTLKGLDIYGNSDYTLSLKAGSKLSATDVDFGNSFGTYGNFKFDANYLVFDKVHIENGKVAGKEPQTAFNNVAQLDFKNVNFEFAGRVSGLDESITISNNMTTAWGNGGKDTDTNYTFNEPTWSDGTWDKEKNEWSGGTNEDTKHIVDDGNGDIGDGGKWEVSTDTGSSKGEAIQEGDKNYSDNVSDGEKDNIANDSKISIDSIEKKDIAKVGYETAKDTGFGKDIIAGEFDPFEKETESGYEKIETINIAHNDEVVLDSNFGAKRAFDTIDFNNNISDEVILDASDFDAAVLEAILGDILKELYKLNIADLEKAWGYINNKEYEKLGALFGFDKEKTESLRQSFDFLDAFYGKGAGDKLAGFGGELAKFDSKYQEFKKARESVKDDTFGNGGIMGEYKNFDELYKAFSKQLEQFKQYIQDLKDGKYGEPGSVEYDNAYAKYENMHANLEKMKNSLVSMSDEIISNINKVYSNSGNKFLITYDGTQIGKVGGVDIPSYEKEQGGGDEGPNSRIFAEDNIYEEDENSAQNSKKGEINETAGKQKARICIVSDNAKAMNPCLALGD
ncbi:filamentous hemagglutinin N-terminal domain-containing protein [Campylobacter sp. US33a]|uniref:filamentous hemagglutinin N-terminal domain-containing protein n=1 Tax=Campylobacter sp. US33a TaxID=2498120 RepID=UPI0010677EB2|nr:filamentous hemagglutinin N-terminal domain-containing protein [Campylobacter sp. US33a]TEY01534.1 filamentous hemagglutinin N-terminal domain-containing protein [Campylobacter sp. US33a]